MVVREHAGQRKDWPLSPARTCDLHVHARDGAGAKVMQNQERAATEREEQQHV